MRYEIGQELVAVHFKTEGDSRNHSFYSTPFMFFSEQRIEKISLFKLTVKEHHRVAWSEDPGGEKKYDGYLLTDDQGLIWANQYPRAAYGQTTTEQDQRFFFHGAEGELSRRCDAGEVVECHLLKDWLENTFRFFDYLQKESITPTKDQLILKENLLDLHKRIESQLKEMGLVFERYDRVYEGGFKSPRVKISKLEAKDEQEKEV